MKEFKILLVLFCSYLGYGQDEYYHHDFSSGIDLFTIKISQDPKMAFKEKALDIRFEFSIREESNIEYGLIAEYFPNRDYISTSLFFGKEYKTWFFYTLPNIEAGLIFRKPDYAWKQYPLASINVKFRLPLGERFGLYISSGLVRRFDLTEIYGPNADKYRFNNYGGIYLILN